MENNPEKNRQYVGSGENLPGVSNGFVGYKARGLQRENRCSPLLKMGMSFEACGQHRTMIMGCSRYSVSSLRVFHFPLK